MLAIEWYYIFAIGVILIALEAFTFTFISFWLGAGFVIASFLTYLGLFENLYAQLAIAAIIGLTLMYLLKNITIKYIKESQDNTEEKPHNKGIGEIYGDSIKFEGSIWKTDADIKALQDGDKVTILDIVKNKLILEEKDIVTN